MTTRDLAFLRELQNKVQQYNSTHKTITLNILDSWNPSKDRYDYRIFIRTSLDPSKSNDRKSIAKAYSKAKSLSDKIFLAGYASSAEERDNIEVKLI